MYKTGFLKVKTQILETILAELPKTAKKLKLSLKFDDQQKLNMFKRLEADAKDQDDYPSLETSSDEQEQNSQCDEKQKNVLKEKSISTKQQNEKPKFNKRDVNLENSIIYNQYFEKQFQRIGESYKVKIKIRAQKITFEGYEILDIEDAMEQAEDLIKSIEVQYIHKYGCEMSESKMITKKLNKIGVKVFRILDKYYRWWQIDPKLQLQVQKQRQRHVKHSLQQIDRVIHSLQYLYCIQEQNYHRKGTHKNDFFRARQKFMSYRPLLLELKGKIFQNEMTFKINESSDPDEIEAQLSVTGDALIFHSQANQYLQMSIKQVRVQYQHYDYFFLTIDTESPIDEAINVLKSYTYDRQDEKIINKFAHGQIEQVKERNFIHFTTNYENAKKIIEDKRKDPKNENYHNQKQTVIFCIGFRRTLVERLEYLCQILKKLDAIWEGGSYKISICSDKSQQTEQNYLSYQFNSNEKIFHLSSHQSKIQNNLSILKDFVINQKLKPKKLDTINEEDSSNISLSTINQSQQIQDSTYLNQKSISQDINNSGILDKHDIFGRQGKSQFFLKEQSKEVDEKALQMLKQYKVFIEQTSKEYNQKYKELDTPDNIILKTDKRNRGLEDKMLQITNTKFQVHKIQLNPKHRNSQFYAELQKDQIVSVFLSGKMNPFVKPKQIGLKIEEGMNQSVTVKLIGSSKQPLYESGYLINLKKENIHIQGKCFRVKYGTSFQVAKQIVYLKPN